MEPSSHGNTEDKMMLRKKRNRESAALSRDRKKRHTEDLEKEVSELQTMKRALMSDSAALRSKLASLKGVDVSEIVAASAAIRRSPRRMPIPEPSAQAPMAVPGTVATVVTSASVMAMPVDQSHARVTSAPVLGVPDTAFRLPSPKAPARRGKGQIDPNMELTPPASSPSMLSVDAPISGRLRSSPVFKGIAPSPRAMAHADVLRGMRFGRAAHVPQ